jgi:hypothetical protein
MLSFITASSSTVFIFPPEQKMYWNTPTCWSLWNYLSNEPSYAWNGFRTRELSKFYSGDAICPRLISDCRSAQWFCHISLYGSSKLMILYAWKQDLKDLLKIKSSSIVHLWTCAQILMETATSLSSLVND